MVSKATATQSRAKKGSVGVEAFQGRLRLRLPRSLYNGKHKYLTLGLDDNAINRKKAELTASTIELDILNNAFDFTLAKYKPQKNKTRDDKPDTPLDLSELWERYTNYRRSQIAETTLRIGYTVVSNHISKLPSQTLTNANKIRDYLLANLSRDSAKRTLASISACCDWAVESGLIDLNPFQGMAKKIKVVKDVNSTIDPFSVEERDAIIQAFETDPVYSFYAGYVKFLFMTGCRTGEAVGLQWKHISSDCSKVYFSQSVSTQHQIRKDTKTHKTRVFPCNKSLQSLLLSIKPENCDPESLVFPGRKGGLLNARSFIENAWKGRSDRSEGIVTRLVREGKVQRYRTQYNTRHSFITHCLESGVSIVQVAKWVGNSPEIIMKHYAGIIKQVEVPEF